MNENLYNRYTREKNIEIKVMPNLFFTVYEYALRKKVIYKKISTLSNHFGRDFFSRLKFNIYISNKFIIYHFGIC